jgi:NTE family protein
MSQESKKEDIKIGLALSGGSTLGIAHVGVLKALYENDINIDYISGTSAGAIVASCFAFDMPIDEIVKVSMKLDWKKISKFSYSKLGLNSNQPMAVLITDLLGDVKIQDSKIPLAIVATNIENYEKVVLTKGDLKNAIRASTCIPGFFAPVEFEGQLLVDGALSENLPLSPLEKMGAEIKIGVNLSSNPHSIKPKNIIDVIINSYTTMSRHRDLNLSNQTDVLIEPDLNKFDFTKFKDMQAIMNEGYDAALKAIPAIKEKIDFLEVEKEKSEIKVEVKIGFFRKALNFFKKI